MDQERPFKNIDWQDRKKEIKTNRGLRHKKTIKQIAAGEALSGKQLNYQSIEAPPSKIPSRKYCDITGFESKYKDSLTDLIFYDRTVCSYIKLLSRPVVQNFLSIRKPTLAGEKAAL